MATKPAMSQESPNVPPMESPPPFEPLEVGPAPVSRFIADNLNEPRPSVVSSSSFDSAPQTSKAPNRETPTVVASDSDVDLDVVDANVESYQHFADAEHESENEAPSRVPLKKGKGKKEKRSKQKREVVDDGSRDADLQRERAGGSHSDAETISGAERPNDQLAQQPFKPEPFEEGIVPLGLGSHETLEVERPLEDYSQLEQQQEHPHELDEGHAGSHPRVVRQKLDKRESISDRIVVTLPAQLQAAAERTGTTDELADFAAGEEPQELGAEAEKVEMQVREEDSLGDLIVESQLENTMEQALEEVISQTVLSEVEEFRPETGGGPPGSPKLPAPGLNNRGELVLLDDELAVLRMQQEYSGSESDESVYDGEDFFIYKLPKMRTTARRIEEPLLLRKRKKHLKEASTHLEEIESM